MVSRRQSERQDPGGIHADSTAIFIGSHKTGKITYIV